MLALWKVDESATNTATVTTLPLKSDVTWKIHQHNESTPPAASIFLSPADKADLT